jgi:hypothetical protein
MGKGVGSVMDLAIRISNGQRGRYLRARLGFRPISIIRIATDIELQNQRDLGDTSGASISAVFHEMMSLGLDGAIRDAQERKGIRHMRVPISAVVASLMMLTSAYASDSEWSISLSTESNVAQAETQKQGADPEKCKAFKDNPAEDIGIIIRAGCEPTLAQMSALMDNPLGNVAMLFTQGDWSRLENESNGRTADQYLYTGIAQFPKKLSEDWNLINRVVWTVPSVPVNSDRIDEMSSQGGAVIPPADTSAAPIDFFSGRTTSFGDMYYVGLFSPAEGIDVADGKFVWGAGFDLAFPTATEDVTGSGKFSAGPSGLAVYLGKKWKIGALLQHYWDYAGEGSRDDVNLTNLQYFIFYGLDDVTSIGVAPNIIANWEQDSDNAFTVPIGIGISRTFQFGKVPVRFGLEYHHSVIQPDDVAGADWNVRFYMIPAAPSALFKWMQ